MSVVSGVVLYTSSAEDRSSPNGLPILFESIQEWLAERAPFQQLNSVEDSFGGSKHPQMFVAGGGNAIPTGEGSYVFARRRR
ncbi:hypothetical protein NKH93_08745 [Mesorhizobium sp. M0954]|uniref:hypothetical protein n=1 Tax=Mesorhizobium sp. M0954 TaxID=2957032 RepID=UPI00333C1CA7